MCAAVDKWFAIQKQPWLVRMLYAHLYREQDTRSMWCACTCDLNPPVWCLQQRELLCAVHGPCHMCWYIMNVYCTYHKSRSFVLRRRRLALLFKLLPADHRRHQCRRHQTVLFTLSGILFLSLKSDSPKDFRMRNSGLLKWAQNNKNNKLSNGKTKEEKKWIHSPDTLVQGHVAYLVKVNRVTVCPRHIRVNTFNNCHANQTQLSLTALKKRAVV